MITVTLLFYFLVPRNGKIFNNDFYFFSFPSRRCHSCYFESAATYLVKKVNCPEPRRIIQISIVKEMFIHSTKKATVK
jgi:hypothetical protein